MAYWERWKLRLQQFAERDRTPPDEPARFEKELDKLLETAIVDGLRFGKKATDENKVVAHVTANSASKPRQELAAKYARLHKRFMELTDARLQESKADMVERLRYLFFRVLTAIFIAAVVLATYWIARELHIPLPMFRPTQVS